jgi:hypothetical protein
MSPRQEAEAIARRIRAYWETRGQFPKVWTEKARAVASHSDDRWFFVVRSDMRGGWPQAHPSSSR